MTGARTAGSVFVGAVLLAVALLAPRPVLAVNTCHALIFFDYVSGANFPVANSILRVRLTLGSSGIGGGTKVTINRVRFELDCRETGTGIPCTDLGSAIEYEGDGTITTTCRDNAGNPVNWSTGHPASAASNEVVFTPNIPFDIPRDTVTGLCALEFDVKVLSQTCSQSSPSAFDPCTIIQLAGFVVPDGDAQCDNGLSSGSQQTIAFPICNYPTGLPCDDHDPCTTDTCNVDTGACSFTPIYCPPTLTPTPTETPTHTPTELPTDTPTNTPLPPTPTPTPFGTPFHVCATSKDVETVVVSGSSYCPSEATTPRPGKLVAERSFDKGVFRVSNALIRFPMSPTLDEKVITSATVTVYVTDLTQADDNALAIAWEYFPWFTDATQCVSCTAPDSPPCVYLPRPEGYHTCADGGINTAPTITGLGKFVQQVNPDTMACLLPQPDGYTYIAIQESPTRHSTASVPSGVNRVTLSAKRLPCLDGYMIAVTATPSRTPPATATPGLPADSSAGAEACAAYDCDDCAAFLAACGGRPPCDLLDRNVSCPVADADSKPSAFNR